MGDASFLHVRNNQMLTRPTISWTYAIHITSRKQNVTKHRYLLTSHRGQEILHTFGNVNKKMLQTMRIFNLNKSVDVRLNVEAETEYELSSFVTEY